MSNIRLLLFIATIFLAGCTLGPKYECPNVAIPEEWYGAECGEEGELDNFVWWEQLCDPVLDWLIQQAATQNLDVQIAATRVLAARSAKDSKKADCYPRLDLTNSYDHVYFSKDALFNGILGEDCCHGKRSVNFFEIGFDAEWELDLFGRISHEVAALKAEEEASEESLNDVWITLSAEIARNYIQLRGLQQRLDIIDKTIETQRQTVALTKDLLARGIVGDVEVHRAEAVMSSVTAQKLPIQLGINKAIFRISVLLGYPPGDLYCYLSAPGCPPMLPCEHPLAVPSELLRRRPDIRRAERQLAAATERIGAAIASLFPRFSLVGFVGDISTNTGRLFNPASFTWLAGPQIVLPIFNSRLVVQDIAYNKNQTQQAIFQYQKTVLEALEETEGAIASFHFEQERSQLLSEAHRSYQVSHQLSEQLYSQGIKDKLAVLDAERELLSAQDSLLQSNIDLILHYIALYKALGGAFVSQP